MGDITVKYESIGFQKVKSELFELEGASRIYGGGQWFRPMAESAKVADQEATALFSTLKSGAAQAASGLGTLVTTAAAVTTVVGTLAAVVGGVAVAGFTSWTTSMLKTTEGFQQMEISLYGALKSWDAVKKVSTFAKEYAAEYPAMYKDVMQSMQSLAFIPATKMGLMEGDVSLMKDFMNIIQGMLTMRPEQGVVGAMMAIREALAGNWRSLQFRFDVPVESIARSANMTMEQMKGSPQEAIKALKAWTDEFVGADTMAMAAKNLGIQMGNVKDKYEMWLDRLGKTGIYTKVVGYLLDLNDSLDKFFKTDKVQKWTEQINAFLESVADRIAGVFTKGIDWEGISSMGDLGNALIQVWENAKEELMQVWAAAKEPLGNALKATFKFVAQTAVTAFTEILLPAIGSAMAGVETAMKSYRKENPLGAVGIEAAGGAVAGFAMGGPKGAAVGAVAGPALQGWTEIMGLVLEAGTGLAKAIEETTRAILEAKPIVEEMPPAIAEVGWADAAEEAVAGWVGAVEEAARAILGMKPSVEDTTSAFAGLADVLRAILGIKPKPVVWAPTPADEAKIKEGKETLSHVKTWNQILEEETYKRHLEVIRMPGEVEKWMKKPLWQPKSKGEAETMGAEWKEPTPWEAKPEQKLGYYQSWKTMAGALAGREEVESPYDIETRRQKEDMAMREKWNVGALTQEQWQGYVKKRDIGEERRGRMEGFGIEKEKMLTGVLGVAEEKKDYGTAGKAYQEMFGISMGKGDFYKAQEYMNKSLENMLKQMEKEEKRGAEDNDSLKNISSNTKALQDMANGLIRENWGKGESKSQTWGLPDEMRQGVRDPYGLGES